MMKKLITWVETIIINNLASDGVDKDSLKLLAPTLIILAGIIVSSTTLCISVYIYARSLKARPIRVPKYPPDYVPHKQRLTEKLVPKEADVIVIGSGIGGLSAAALLSRVGKKVLVLEQWTKAGGCTHMFSEKGYHFDTGVHYLPITLAARSAMPKVLMDMVTAEPIRYASLGAEYDTIVFRDGHEKFALTAGLSDLKSKLVERFPSEEAAIEKYVEKQREMEQSLGLLVQHKCIPPFLKRFLNKQAKKDADQLLSTKTAYEGLREFTDNEELIAILTSQWPDFGMPPKEGAFAMSALIHRAYVPGALYPIGGSEVFAESMVPVIEGAGGKVLVAATVDEILTGAEGKVEGVRVKTKGGTAFTVKAPVVISDAGALNTYKNLVKTKGLPRGVANSVKESVAALEGIGQSMATLTLFVGLKGTKDELELPTGNLWVYESIDYDGSRKAYLSSDSFPRTPEGKAKTPPMMFISFPSAKDPEHESEDTGKSTCCIIAEASFDWFKKWKNTKSGKRGADYDELKKTISAAMLGILYEHFPQLADKVDLVELGTPLSNDYYIGSLQGAAYGLSFPPERFSESIQAHLGPRTCIPGLYLSGQDVVVDGVLGALFGGVAAACATSWKIFPALIWELADKIRIGDRKNPHLKRMYPRNVPK